MCDDKDSPWMDDEIKALIKDTHKEKSPSNKTPAITKVRTWSFGPLVHQINFL